MIDKLAYSRNQLLADKLTDKLFLFDKKVTNKLDDYKMTQKGILINYLILKYKRHHWKKVKKRVRAY